MKVVRVTPVNHADPPTFLSWAKKIFNYFRSLPGQVIHSVIDNFSYIDDLTSVLSKGRVNKRTERKISNLNQLLSKPDEWQNFLTHEKNRFHICNLLADYFTWYTSSSKTIYVTKEDIYHVKPVDKKNGKGQFYSKHREANHRYGF